MLADRTADAVERVLAAVDPRAVDEVRRDFDRCVGTTTGLAPDRRWVIAGHRAAGKTTLLPLVGAFTDRPAIDLDRELERERGAPIREWFGADPGAFRAAERAAFSQLPTRVLVAVGGGFLSQHPDLLGDAVVIVVPLRFETYRERLIADRSRPRLLPELTLEEELRRTFAERERAHAAVNTLSLGQALAALSAGLKE